MKVGSNMLKFDNKTKEWFRNNVDRQTTLVRCSKCGLWYKPSLGHKCSNKRNK